MERWERGAQITGQKMEVPTCPAYMKLDIFLDCSPPTHSVEDIIAGQIGKFHLVNHVSDLCIVSTSPHLRHVLCH